MEATLRVGDVVLAEKLSCRLQLPYEVDDLVLFSPPRALQELVQSAGGKPLGSRDLFVKRVAAVAGDEVSLLPDGNVAVNGVPRQRSPMACVEEQRAARPGGRSGAGAAAAMDEGAKPEARVIPDGSLVRNEGEAIERPIEPGPLYGPLALAPCLCHNLYNRLLDSRRVCVVRPLPCAHLARPVCPRRLPRALHRQPELGAAAREECGCAARATRLASRAAGRHRRHRPCVTMCTTINERATTSTKTILWHYDWFARTGYRTRDCALSIRYTSLRSVSMC